MRRQHEQSPQTREHYRDPRGPGELDRAHGHGLREPHRIGDEHGRHGRGSEREGCGDHDPAEDGPPGTQVPQAGDEAAENGPEGDETGPGLGGGRSRARRPGPPACAGIPRATCRTSNARTAPSGGGGDGALIRSVRGRSSTRMRRAGALALGTAGRTPRGEKGPAEARDALVCATVIGHPRTTRRTAGGVSHEGDEVRSGGQLRGPRSAGWRTRSVVDRAARAPVDPAVAAQESLVDEVPAQCGHVGVRRA